jgi:hypothetical protein
MQVPYSHRRRLPHASRYPMTYGHAPTGIACASSPSATEERRLRNLRWRHCACPALLVLRIAPRRDGAQAFAPAVPPSFVRTSRSSLSSSARKIKSSRRRCATACTTSGVAALFVMQRAGWGRWVCGRSGCGRTSQHSCCLHVVVIVALFLICLCHVACYVARSAGGKRTSWAMRSARAVLRAGLAGLSCNVEYYILR